jgi:PTH2 family peptidyl-tRNA hydrolase
VLKQVIVIRTDVGMGKGKLAAQVAHASLETYFKSPPQIQKKWREESQKKIVLKVASEKALLDIFQHAKSAGLPCSLIRDAGHTQVPPGTKTAVGIGPAEAGKIDQVTGHLSLL